MVEEFARDVDGRTSGIAGRDSISVMSKKADERENLRHGGRKRKEEGKVKSKATRSFIINLDFVGGRKGTNRHSEK